MLRPVANEQLRVEGQSGPALEVLDVPLAPAHVGADVVVVAIVGIWVKKIEIVVASTSLKAMEVAPLNLYGMAWNREVLLKGKAQYSWPPCTN